MALPPVIIHKLKTDGERITPVRTALLDILVKQQKPYTPQELLILINRRGFGVNKTTIYRQLQTLRRHGVIQEVRLADRTMRYELMREGEHHHHLVCIQCHRIADISFRTDLWHQEKIIQQKNKFKVLRHALEFFGLCKSCQKRG